jgi:hypothetical protein
MRSVFSVFLAAVLALGVFGGCNKKSVEDYGPRLAGPTNLGEKQKDKPPIKMPPAPPPPPKK